MIPFTYLYDTNETLDSQCLWYHEETGIYILDIFKVYKNSDISALSAFYLINDNFYERMGTLTDINDYIANTYYDCPKTEPFSSLEDVLLDKDFCIHYFTFSAAFSLFVPLLATTAIATEWDNVFKLITNSNISNFWGPINTKPTNTYICSSITTPLENYSYFSFRELPTSDSVTAITSQLDNTSYEDYIWIYSSAGLSKISFFGSDIS